MSLFKKLFSKERETAVFRYNESEREVKAGPPIHPKDWLEKRESHYTKYLGPISEQILHDTTNTIPHIDIYTVPPDERKDREYTTIVTSGMSDILQTLPKGLKEKEADRIEVLWHVKSAETWMYDFLVALAKMPFQYKSYYWRFHTLENGFPNPLPDSLYKHLILLPAFFEEDGFNNDLVLDGLRVSFLWLIPITKEEMDYKLENGAEAFLDLAEKKSMPLVYNPDREPLI